MSRSLAIAALLLVGMPAMASEYTWTLVTNPAAFPPRDGPGALTYNNAMWLLGGWNGIRYNDVWSSTDGQTWTVATNAAGWEPRHSAGYAVLNNMMWVFGGDANSGHYQPDVWNSSDGVNWQEVTANAPWGQRADFCTAVHDGKIWVMGGQTEPDSVLGVPEHFYNDVWSSADGANWTQVTANAPWAPRGLIGGSVEFNGRMWLIGGGTYSTPDHPARIYYNEVWSSADGIDWRLEVAHAPWCPREYASVAVFDGRMWLLSGWNGGNLNDVWYSSDGINWTQLDNTPWAPGHARGVFVYNDALWIAAGSDPQPASDVWRLDKNALVVCDAGTINPPTAAVGPSCDNPSITVSWSQPSAWANATSGTYAVYRSSTSTFSDACPISNPIASNLTSTTYSDTSGVAGTTYYYFVAATNNCPQSAVTTYSTASNAITYPPVGAPTIPTNLVAVAAGTTQINLSWTAAAGAAEYVVTRSSGGGPPSTIGFPVSNNFGDNQNLASGTTYVYRVAANNSCGQSAFSNPDIATTTVFTDDPLVPMETVIKTVHLTELRSAVNAARIAAGLQPFAFTDSDPTGIAVKAVHVQELRSALDEARSMIGLPQINYMNTLVAGSTQVQAIDMTEIRNGVK